MKKIMLIVILSMAGIGTVNGQALIILLFGDKLSTPTFQMGVNADISYTTVTGTDNADPYMNWAFGALFEYKMSEKWYLGFDLTLKTPAGATNINPLFPPDSAIYDFAKDIKTTLKSNYISLPVWIKYKTGKFKWGIGAQVAYRSGSTQITEGTTHTGTDFKGEYDLDNLDLLNSWDFALSGTIDYYFDLEKDMKSLRLSLKYAYGLTDIIKDNSGDAIYNSQLLIALGIPIGGTEK